jgi:hypothetical protein
MWSLRDQPTRLLKRRWRQLSREGLALIQETMERAMAQETTETAYHELAHLAEQCLGVFGKLQPGDIVTREMATECSQMLTQLQELLTRHKGEQTEEDPQDTTV